MPDPKSLLSGPNNLLWLKRDQLGFYAAMQARHGDAVLVRLGPYRMWLLFHPDAVGAVLTEHASAFIRFEPVMRILAQWNGRSLIISEGDRWRARRRQVLPAFASRRLPGYGDRIVARTLAFLDRWTAATANGVLTTDTDRAMAALALDVAVDTLFDKQMDGEAASIGAAVATLSDVAFQESTSLLRLPAWLHPPWSRKRRAMGQMDQLVTGIVRDRLAGQASDRGDLLSMLTNQEDDARAIRDEVMTLLIAGHETSGALLTWAALALSQHPPVLESLQAELSTVLAGRPPAAADLPAMPLLRSVIEETLRLYEVVPSVRTGLRLG